MMYKSPLYKRLKGFLHSRLFVTCFCYTWNTHVHVLRCVEFKVNSRNTLKFAPFFDPNVSLHSGTNILTHTETHCVRVFFFFFFHRVSGS